MNSFRRIIQLTDLHITAEGEHTKNGIDTVERAALLFKTLRKENHDLLVLSGDLCYSLGNEATYRWLKEQLQDWKVPVQLIGGNHDDLSVMNKVFADFPHYSNKEAFTFSLHGKEILFLETGNGLVSEQQLEFLKNALSKTQNPILLFMHHPPFLGNVQFMDKRHALKNTEQMEAFFAQYPEKEFIVFCGHYHIEKSIRKKNVTLYITPSPFFNLNPDYDEFQQENTLIPYRIIDVYEEEVDTRVKFVG